MSKKILPLLLCCSFLVLIFCGSASAFQFKLDFGALSDADKTILGGFSGSDDGETGYIQRFGVAGASLISQNDDDGNGLDPGDTFSETFISYVDGFQPGLADTEGLNSAYELTMVTSGLSGQITSAVTLTTSSVLVGYTFTPGSTVDFYLDAPAQFPQDPYSDITLADGTNPSGVNLSNYTDGVKIASATLISGLGTSVVVPSGGATPDTDQGSTNLTYAFDFLYDDMFLDSFGVDLNDFGGPQFVITLPAFDIDETITTVANNKTGTAFDAKVLNDGSAPLSPVPEPGTLVLFGCGLLFAAGVLKRKCK